MSRPGYWKGKDCPEIPITSMTNSHLKNSIRLLSRKYLEHNSLSIPQGNTLALEVKQRRLSFYEDKIIELGNLAQTRNLIPAGDIEATALINTASNWATSYEPGFIAGPRPVATTTPPPALLRPSVAAPTTWVEAVKNTIAASRADSVARAAATPPKRLGKFVNVIREVEITIGFPIYGIPQETIPGRKIDMEL